MSCPVLFSCQSKQSVFVTQRRGIAPTRTHYLRAGKKWDDVASDMIDEYMKTGSIRPNPDPAKIGCVKDPSVAGCLVSLVAINQGWHCTLDCNLL